MKQDKGEAVGAKWAEDTYLADQDELQARSRKKSR